MKALPVLKFIFIIIAVFFLFWGAISLFAETPPPPPEPPPCVPSGTTCSSGSPYRCNDFAVYKCGNNFCGKSGGAIEQGAEWYECVDWSCSDGCDGSSGTDVVGGPFGPDQIKPYGTVPDYQICPAVYNDWGTTPPVTACSGSCYPAPNLKNLNDASLLPKNVPEESSFKLPINFGTEDNVKQEVAKAPNFCTVGSYEFNVTDPSVSKISTSNQLQTLSDTSYKFECQIKSDGTYQWKARACLDSGGTDCGEWPGTQDFNTSPAPELISPYDADWNGINKIKDVKIPTRLDWCDISQSQSYFLKLYKDGKLFYPVLIDKDKNKRLYSELNLGTEVLTKYNNYDWEVASCLNENGTNCGNYSQYWKFATGDIGLPAPKILTPISTQGIPVVNMSDNLSWESVALMGVLSYQYEIKKENTTIIDSNTTGAITSVSFKDLWNKLKFDQLYSWTVRSCWDEEGKKCEIDKSAASFKTTGAPPTNIQAGPLDKKGEVIIPTSLKFDAMPGAGSYYYEVSSAKGTIPNSLSPVGWADYSDLKTKTNYSVQIKTCADDKGLFCGEPATKNFTTFTLSNPQNPKPASDGNLLTYEKQLAWDAVEGARYYQYKVVSGPEGIVQTNSTFLATEKLELGSYAWSVRACLDKDCQEAGEWSTFNFNLIQSENCKAGLVSCGRNCNSTETPWNDRKPCQFKDIFLVLQNIINLVLWTLVPIALVLLALASGVIYYTSMGNEATTARVKRIWRSVGIGLGIIFLAWLAINLLLALLGFQVKIFGHWWQLPF